MNTHRLNGRVSNSIRRLEAYDRRLAAIHEAGHALMAIYLGYRADAWIHRNSVRDPLSQKTWLGHMTMYDRPLMSGHEHVRMIAVAGMVAEVLWKNGHDEDYTETWGWEDILLDGDSMSPSDWRLAGYEPGQPDDDLFQVAATVADLFIQHLWPALTGMSRTLIKDAGAVHSFNAMRCATAA